MAVPIWVNLISGEPAESAFSSTTGLGTPIVIDGDTSVAYYIKSGSEILPIGGYPTTYIERISDFSNDTSTAADSELTFTPEPDSLYVVEGQFLLTSTSASKGPVLGITLPSNLSSAMIELRAAKTSSAEVTAFGNSDISLTVAPFTQYATMPAALKASFRTSGNSAGDFSVTLAIEA